MTEKDIHRLEKSARKMEEALVKADREYREANVKTEESRLAWEAAMYRCCRVRHRGAGLDPPLGQLNWIALGAQYN